MPELPDLLYIVGYLQTTLPGRSIRHVTMRRPVILRDALDVPVSEALLNRTFRSVGSRGPFLTFALSEGIEIIVNLMVAGRLQHRHADEKDAGYLCLSLTLDDGTSLNVCDEQEMAKVYVVRAGEYAAIPKYASQGIDILSEAFTPEAFRALATAHGRRQVRVLINDHAALSAIGNAYADEILFEARIHPKTLVRSLSNGEIDRLYAAIRDVLDWGRAKVEQAGQPIHVKVRDHMKVRNRRGEPCPRCGTTIRREGVRGHDVYFCPACQPASRRLFIDWRNLPDSKE